MHPCGFNWRDLCFPWWIGAYFLAQLDTVEALVAGWCCQGLLCLQGVGVPLLHALMHLSSRSGIEEPGSGTELRSWSSTKPYDGDKTLPPPLALSPPPFNLLEKPCIRDVSAEVALSVSHCVFCQTLVWLLWSQAWEGCASQMISSICMCHVRAHFYSSRWDVLPVCDCRALAHGCSCKLRGETWVCPALILFSEPYKEVLFLLTRATLSFQLEFCFFSWSAEAFWGIVETQ